MKLFMILFDLMVFLFVGAVAFKTYAYLTEKKFKLSRKKISVCLVAGGIIDSLSKLFQSDIMLLKEHLFYGVISAVVFAILFSCLFAFITVKKEEAARRKQLRKMRAKRYTADITVYRPEMRLERVG